MSQTDEELDTTNRSIYDVFETDENLENNGIDFDCGFGTFTLAYVGNDDFARDYADAMKPYAEAAQRGLLEAKTQRKILVGVYARTVVKGWKNVYGRNQEEIVFSVEECEKLMIALPRLFSMIREWAGNFANYRKTYVEGVVGN